MRGAGQGASVLVQLARLPRDYAHHAWKGLVAPRLAPGQAHVVVQGVVRSERGILLALRNGLRGWELPGGAPEKGEICEEALWREILEETGIEVEVGRLVGEYVRSGFRPHTARVYECRTRAGCLRPSPATPQVGWFPTDALPETLFPWFRGPLEDALARHSSAVRRVEHHGLGAILAGMRIDLRTRLAGRGLDRTSDTDIQTQTSRKSKPPPGNANTGVGARGTTGEKSVTVLAGPPAGKAPIHRSFARLLPTHFAEAACLPFFRELLELL